MYLKLWNCSFLVFLLLVIKTDAGTVRASDSNGTITLEDVLDGKYAAGGFNGVWIDDTRIEYRDSKGNIRIKDVGPVYSDEEVLSASTFAAYEGGMSFSYSPDRDYVIVKHNVKPNWRYSTYADYAIYTISTGTFEDLQPVPSPTEQIALFQWDASGNGFAVVYETNIYYRSSADAGTPWKEVTTSGVNPPNSVISNGLADWVYEEEMLGSSSAMWFGIDPNKLAYIQFDDTNVKDFSFTKYGEPGADTIYPEQVQFKYPKAGETNPAVSLRVVPDLAQAVADDFLTFVFPELAGVETLIGTVKWLTSETFLVIHFNRVQSHSYYYVCIIPATGAPQDPCRLAHEDVSTAWIDLYIPRVSTSGQYLMSVAPVEVAAGQTYKQIVQIDLQDANPVTRVKHITKERFAVGSILGWDETGNKVYFSATGLEYDENGQARPTPSSTHIYSVGITGNSEPETAVRLTRGLKNSDNVICKANRASFSTGLSNWIHTCSGPGIPEVAIRRNDQSRTHVETVQDNANLRTMLRDIDLPKQLHYSIPIPNTNFAINVRLFVPVDFNENSGIKYPLLIDVYGGPGSQAISDSFRIDWGTSLVTDKRVIYGIIDGRGSAGQTQELMNSIYKRLGTYEVDDQIYAVKWLLDNYYYIDANHTGIWGWSYGGFATAMTLAFDIEDVFKCGISVAPVTSYRYYDTIYTERYMLRPQDNPDGYLRAQMTMRAEGFRDKDFLLVHGNADDNVHYQNSMILARSLELADVPFDQMSYPEENHGIGTPQRHLYHAFERFLFRSCLKQEVPQVQSSSGALGAWISLTLLSLLAIWFI